MTRQPAELRDPAAARAFILQSLWLQRTGVPDAISLGLALDLAARIVSEGHALLPLGLLADAANLLVGTPFIRRDPLPGFPAATLRAYEDHLLGRLSTDQRFERAGIALRRYEAEERPRGLAFVMRQWQSRWKLAGVELSPAILRELRREDTDTLLREGYESHEAGPLPVLLETIDEVIRASRREVDVLAPEDVVALEQRMALAEYSQFVAHRQLLRQSAVFEAGLPARPPKRTSRHRESPTRLTDEDLYPVGGYASIGTRGSLESLLHSQLAYMEDAERPDLFDVKYVRDELFYYTRDENQFHRRRRAFAIHFAGDLVHARFKDADQSVQRIVLAGALVLALVRKLIDWLSHDSLHFSLTFDPALEAEADLFRVLLTDEVRRVIVKISAETPAPGILTLTSTGTRELNALIVQATPQLLLDGEVQEIIGKPWAGCLHAILLHSLRSC